MASTPSDPLLLHLFIMSANSLMKKDLFGMCDPYVKVSLRRDKKVISKHTKTVKKTRNPEWNEKVDFKDVNSQKDLVLFEVFDANRLTRDNFLGRVIIKLSQFPMERRKVDITRHGNPMKFDLRGRSAKSRVSGTIKIKFLYYNDPVDSGPPVPPRNTSSRSRHQLNISSLVPGSGMGNRPLPPTPTPTSPNPMLGESRNGMNRQETVVANEWSMIEGDDEDDEQEPPLPRGWERRMDGNGRVFYVDHANRRTQWERPRATQNDGEVRERLRVERHRQFQQTMRRRIPTSDTSSTSDESPSLSTRTTPTSSVSSLPPPSPVARPRPSPTTPQRPASVFDQQRSTNGDDDLPPGWEMRLAPNGRKFYVDHTTRKTTWVHPNRQRAQSVSPAPTPSPQPTPAPRFPRQPQPIPHPRSPTPQQSLPQPLIQQPNTERSNTPNNAPQQNNSEDLGPLPNGWEMRILDDGRKFFIDHNTKSTQWEDPRKKKVEKKSSAMPAYDRDYKRKYEAFQKILLSKKPDNLPRMFEIPVRRDHLFEDSHKAIMTVKDRNFMKARLWVKFNGETGLDYGGLAREWFFLLSHEMLNPYYGLFEYAASDNYTLQINPDSGLINEQHLDFFRFIGRIFAMAVYHKKLIDAFFIRPFYKMLLSKSVTLSDMESVDTEFYNSVKYILEEDPEPLCLTFTASREFLGQVEEIELKPNGGEIDVTEDNKKEYVKLLVKWRFEDRVKQQMEAIKKGFNDLIPLPTMKMFDERELEYLMCGLADINVDDWRKNTIYHNGYTAQDQVVIWFWKAVEDMDSENRARLLQFVTGTSKVPMNGFAELQGSNGPQRFCIKKLGNADALPRSHTCFNRIDLPPYRSYHELKEKLKIAIENTEGFEGVD